MYIKYIEFLINSLIFNINLFLAKIAKWLKKLRKITIK